jgi:hypothetical protein
MLSPNDSLARRPRTPDPCVVRPLGNIAAAAGDPSSDCRVFLASPVTGPELCSLPAMARKSLLAERMMAALCGRLLCRSARLWLMLPPLSLPQMVLTCAPTEISPAIEIPFGRCFCQRHF